MPTVGLGIYYIATPREKEGSCRHEIMIAIAELSQRTVGRTNLLGCAITRAPTTYEPQSEFDLCSQLL